MSEELPPEPEREPESERTPDPAPAPPAEPPGETAAGRRTMIMVVAAAVVVLIAIGVGIYLVATSGEDDVAADPGTPTITDSPQPEAPASTPPPSEPPASPAPSTAPAPPPDKNVAAVRTAAEQAADAINERDVDAMQKLSCDPSVGGSVEEFPPEATARLTENPQITGDKATAQIELSISGSEPTVVPLLMEKRDGRWCVP